MARCKGPTRTRAKPASKPHQFDFKTIYIFWIFLFAVLMTILILLAMPPLTVVRTTCVFVAILTVSAFSVKTYLAALEKSMNSEWWAKQDEKASKKRLNELRWRKVKIAKD